MNTLEQLEHVVLTHPEEDAAAAMLLDECIAQHGWSTEEASRYVAVIRQSGREAVQLSAAAKLLAEDSKFRDRIIEVAIGRASHGVRRNWFVLLVPGSASPRSSVVDMNLSRWSRDKNAIVITGGWVLWIVEQIKAREELDRQDRAEEEPL